MYTINPIENATEYEYNQTRDGRGDYNPFIAKELVSQRIRAALRERGLDPSKLCHFDIRMIDDKYGIGPAVMTRVDIGYGRRKTSIYSKKRQPIDLDRVIDTLLERTELARVERKRLDLELEHRSQNQLEADRLTETLGLRYPLHLSGNDQPGTILVQFEKNLSYEQAREVAEFLKKYQA